MIHEVAGDGTKRSFHEKKKMDESYQRNGRTNLEHVPRLKLGKLFIFISASTNKTCLQIDNEITNN
ncbi:uncharacterized protein CELE_C46H11.1 [Caenorhabditis elegans]|uniref:Uncharacterized protein n=1 Tax=Caenorhabditis elegans TaxID=6239 RepID=Q9GYI9_CAEEL|nr:Uncharacterized protein CELE_C46H11.1 [Caenorhabditis elegans]CCD66215.1 Uncharacterized protein CELE_C46H11.1 [Caenorhabditis elegans]|eukprot:NP_491512.1 Uncharacterized protein CELE_C46H11.1 [Caenorhabditis elegans]